ncbi:MAG: hypothetical protein RL410_77 [Actinomycetota bacterium]|jgi:ATP:corrinoid adenosyltransferase
MAINTFPTTYDVNDLKRPELRVYEALLESLPDGSDIFVHVEGIPSFERREIDFVVSIPGIGIAILEVKGGQIRAEANLWEQYNIKDHKWHSIDVVKQLDEERRMLTSILRREFGIYYPRIKNFLVAPDAVFDMDRSLPFIEREQVIDQNQLENIADVIAAGIASINAGIYFGDAEQALVRAALTDVGLTYDELVESSYERFHMTEQLTYQQSYVLDMLQDNRFIYVRGGPGSGKTQLAILQAIRLMSQGLKVGVLCYNIGLSELLKHKFAGMAEHLQPAYVGAVGKGLAGYWGIDVPSEISQDETNQFYDVTLPQLMLERAQSLTDEEKFDAWVIDEAQDLNRGELRTLEAALRPNAAGIYLFGDPEQDLWDREGEVPWTPAFARLSRNFRNSRKIAALVNDLQPTSSGEPMGYLGGYQPEYVVAADRQAVFDIAEAKLQELKEKWGWKAGQIVVLTIANRHSTHDKLRTADDAAYWKNFFDAKDVFYGRSKSFKGLERAVALVIIDDDLNWDENLDDFVVGISRGRDELIVVGTDSDLAALQRVESHFNVIRLGKSTARS